ncbi:MAG: hypothetical protein HZA18_02685 [Nitrospirae bacterium]|nr:hypothetical protein [Nitrospirota bacterium]
MNIMEVIAYIAIGYLVVIPSVLYLLSRSTLFIEEGDQERGNRTGTEGEDEEYRKAA